MQLLHITKQVSGHKGLKRKPAPFFLAVAAGHRRGLRSDGAQSPEVVLPILQKLLRKKGSDEFNVSHPRLHQGGLAVSHRELVQLRIANSVLELLGEEVAKQVGAKDT